MAWQIGSGYKGIGKPIIQRDNWQAENHSARAAAWFQRMTDLGILKIITYKAELRGRPTARGCFWQVSFNVVLGIKWNHSFKTSQNKKSLFPSRCRPLKCFVRGNPANVCSICHRQTHELRWFPVFLSENYDRESSESWLQSQMLSKHIFGISTWDVAFKRF